MTSDELKELLTEYIEITKNNLEIFAKHSKLFPKADPKFKTKAWTEKGKEKVAMTYESSTGKRYKNKSKIKNKTYRNVTLQRGSKNSGYLSSGNLAPYIAILNENHKQTVNNGIYPFYYYDLNDDVLLLKYGKSNAKIPNPTWTFSKTGEKLDDRIYKKYYNASTSYKSWDFDQMLSDLDDMIDDYEIALGIDRTKRADGTEGSGTGYVLAAGEAGLGGEKKDGDPKKGGMDDKNPSHPLNLILYGPPGTGKTYNTLFHALAIIRGEDVGKLQEEVENGTTTYEDLKKEYDKCIDTTQIVFTTFHQSMSYEDFIEGIKPIPVSGKDEKDKIIAIHKNGNPSSKDPQFGEGVTIITDPTRMKYEVKDGVFKQICKDAEKSHEISHKIVLKDVIDYFCYDYEKFGSQTEVTRGTKIFRISTLNVKKDGSYKSIELTSGTENQSIQLDVIRRDYGDFITGKIKSYKDIKPSRISKSPVYGNSELCFGLLQKIKDFEDNRYPQYTSGTLNTEVTGKQNYVFIIDEINRGNVAQIFGELITLIEPSKRLGNSEEMKAILPYSSAQKGKPEYFGVPNNLYIIGTMNTADRSVEALDTALRRRFSFEEMMPNPKLLTKIQLTKGDPIDLKEVLEKINDRIIVLKDREHQIGHSYFMGHDDKNEDGSDKYQNKEEWLTNVFKDKIIPLLQEYFYGDYKKIYYVLGPGFVEPITDNKSEDIFPVKIDDDFDIDQNITRYEIKSFDEINIEEAVKDLISSTKEKAEKKKEKIEKEKMKEELRKEGYKVEDIIEIVDNGKDKSLFTPEL